MHWSTTFVRWMLDSLWAYINPSSACMVTTAIHPGCWREASLDSCTVSYLKAMLNRYILWWDTKEVVVSSLVTWSIEDVVKHMVGYGEREKKKKLSNFLRLTWSGGSRISTKVCKGCTLIEMFHNSVLKFNSWTNGFYWRDHLSRTTQFEQIRCMAQEKGGLRGKDIQILNFNTSSFMETCQETYRIYYSRFILVGLKVSWWG